MIWTKALLFLLGTSINGVRAVDLHGHDIHDYDGTRTSFQNGRLNGAIVATGLDYAHNMVFATGSTRGSNGDKALDHSMCFTSRFNLDQLNNHTQTMTGNIGNGTVDTSCNALSMLKEPTHYLSPVEDKPFVVIGSEYNTAHNVTHGRPHGFAIAELPWESKADGGVNLNDWNATHGLSYPRSVQYVHHGEVQGNDGSDDGIAIIASVVSRSKHMDANVALLNSGRNIPDLKSEAHLHSQFELSMQKMRTKFYPQTEEHKSHTNMTLENTVMFPVDTVTYKGNETKPDAMVSGMIMTKNGDVIVAGYTSGNGAAYGVGSGPENVDGFLTVITPNLNLRSSNPVARMASEKEDMFLGICDDVNNPDYFYVVGASGDKNLAGDLVDHESAFKDHELPENFESGAGQKYGFVQRRRVDNLQMVWGRYWPAVKMGVGAAPTAGISCKHIEDGTLYVAGIVENGAHVVVDRSKTHNFDDIVAMSMKDDTGSTNWFTQFGSEDGHETVAKNGGIAIDKHNNMVIYGDTTGSLFRKRDDTTDNLANIYLATLLQGSGKHDVGNWIVHHTEQEGQLSGDGWKDSEVHGFKDTYTKEWIAAQSGPTEGSTFAAGMVYDPVLDEAFVTGIVDNPNNMKSSCMVSAFDLHPGGFDGFSGARGAEMGSQDYFEVCTGLDFRHDDEAIVVGHAESGSDMHKGHTGGGPWAGFASSFDRTTFHEKAGHVFTSHDPQNNILYPVDIATEGDDMYVLSMVSKDNTVRQEWTDAMNSGGSPNWINIPKYGSSFDMTLTKAGTTGDNITQSWTSAYEIDLLDSQTGTGIVLGGVIIKNGYVVVSGSTRSTGTVFGAGDGGATGDYEDAFFSTFDMKTGNHAKASREETPGDDYVLGMCHDKNDPDHFYVVGGMSHLSHAGDDSDTTNAATSLREATAGSTFGFLFQVDAHTLEPKWKSVVGAVHSNNGSKGQNTKASFAKAVDCAVRDKTLYVAGNVLDGATVVSPHERIYNSRGGDDIWFASFNIDDGSMNWLHQEGSAGDDHIAPRGGVAFKANGNMFIYGDTDGELFRFHEDPNRKERELFMFEVGDDGKYMPHVRHEWQAAHTGEDGNLHVKDHTIGHNGANGSSNYPHAAPVTVPAPTFAPVPSPTSPPVPAPVPAPQAGPVPTPTRYPTVAPVSGPVTPPTSPPFLYNEDLAAEAEATGLSTGAIVALSSVGSVVFIAILIILFYFCRRKRTGKEKTLSDGIMTSEVSPPVSSFRDDPAATPEGYTDDPAENLTLDEDKGIV